MNNGQLSNGDEINQAIAAPLEKAIVDARNTRDAAEQDMVAAFKAMENFEDLRREAYNAAMPPTVVCFTENDMCHAKVLVWHTKSIVELESLCHRSALEFCKTMLSRGTWVQCVGVFKDDAWQYDVKLESL